MAEYRDRERFIPYRKADVVDMCATAGRLAEAEQHSFREWCRVLESLFHFEFHARLEALKDSYAPFDPDADTRCVRTWSDEEKHALQRRFVDGLRDLLVAANYESVSDEDLRYAMSEESLFRIRLQVDLDDFEEVKLFRRGESTKRETVKQLFGLRKEEIEFTNYERVVIYVKFREQSPAGSGSPEAGGFRPGTAIIKLFQNVPKADLEMLLPNIKVRMKTLDKLLIGVPAAVSGAVVIVTKLGASLLLILAMIGFWLGLRDEPAEFDKTALVALGLGLAAVGGFLFRQVSRFKDRKIRFMKALAENLYFRNLDNNAGVFHHLLDAAEEEECKEAILAYYFLLTSERGLTREQLDDTVEQWFEERWGCQLDFEVEDALGKLDRLGLVRLENGVWRCLPLDEAKRHLDHIWDNYFDFGRPESEAAASC